MDTSIKCLINSISRFIHLVSCQTVIVMPLQQDYKRLAGVLKLVKALLDEVTDYEYSEKILYKHCEELDMAVNEVREFMEKWSPKMSKICCAIWSEPLLKKIQSSALKICSILQSSSTLAGVKPCMQEIQSLKRETIIEYIEEALGSQGNNVFPGTKHLMRISELLGLTSSQELLKESIAVEKERIIAELNEVKPELNQIDQVVVLVSDIRQFMVKSERREATTGVPIPSYFRCPLSAELMLDPVIVASGQTYERSSIQKWLDHGLTVCPKTRQLLTHKNMTPNYTVKAMIATWCEENNVKTPLISDHSNIVSVPSLSNRNNSTSRASLETGNRFEKQHGGVSPGISGEKSNGCERSKSGNRSPEELFIHSRSVSTSSAISSIDYVLPAFKDLSIISIKPETRNDCFGEITTESVGICPPSNESRIYPLLSGKELHISETKADMAGRGIIKFNRDSYSSSNSVSEDLITASLVTNLIEDLRSPSIEVQTKAAEELRLLAKHNMQNRIIISQCGAIKPLLSLLYSDMKLTQEQAVTALLNLSINEKSKVMIAETGAIDPLIHVLKTGNDAAKENSAAALFSLSVLEEYKAKIGRSSAVKALVDLLRSGTLRGKKDAATALFNLSIFHENKARIVQAGAIKYLINLMYPDSGMVDKSVALLANLSTIGEGCIAIVREEGIPLLIEIAESGSHRSKENAASILLQLCLHSPKFCTMVLQEGAVPPLVALSQSGTPRAKEKAQQLLSHFRNHREGPTGKGKS